MGPCGLQKSWSGSKPVHKSSPKAVSASMVLMVLAKAMTCTRAGNTMTRWVLQTIRLLLLS
uniref:Uncharacterized protein n=1 Tax=Brassica oleracea TaxID=3712 RepID=A0A3P6DE36_BRAOL|nr:unnamed protein product [Brassica oleracea]